MKTLEEIHQPRQLSMFRDLVVDNFAGGGGASTGIEWALGRPVDIAVNHSAEAIAMHEANHPLTKHFCESVWTVDPIEVTEGKRVKLAWFSPDCTHFSNAKGGKPRSKNIRALCWVILKWAYKVKPDVIMIENVREFMKYGPLDEEGHPVKELEGKFFQSFMRGLQRLGFKAEVKCLQACDYGDATNRTRLFVVARSDGQPIIWPEPTHGPGRLFPYLDAAGCIDWSLPMTSIFERKKPLADNSLKRIVQGIKRFVLESANPFLVILNHAGETFRGQALDAPLNTITASRDANVIIAPVLTQSGYGEREGQRPRFLNIQAPLGCAVAGGIKHALSCATLIKNYGGKCKPENGSADIGEPMPAITTKDHNGLLMVNLVRHFGTSSGADIGQPMPSVMPGGAGGKTGLVASFLSQYNGESIGTDLTDPMNTVTSRSRFALITIGFIEYILADILYRMLVPRELYRAQGFPDSYIIDPIYRGKPLGVTAQTRLVGNSVPPGLVCALVKANCAVPASLPARKRGAL